jgi:thiol-disulfide isomerase/thioredoxin
MRRGDFRLLMCVAMAAACASGAPAKLGPAPTFRLRDVAGGHFESKSLAGKVAVVDFWATWCGPCIAEIPDYNEFWKRNHERGVEVLGVAVDFEDPQEISDFVAQQRMSYRQLLGDDKVREGFGVNEGLPTTFVVDAQGQIVLRMLGSAPGKFESLQKAVDAALAQRPH